MTATTAPPRPTRRAGRRPSAATRSGMWAGILFVLPMLVLFIIFRFVPSLGAVGMSLTDYQLSGDFSVVWFDNYARMAGDEVFHGALITTLVYAAIYVPLVVVVSMATALVLNRLVWGTGFFRGALFLPYVTSFVLAGVIWLWIFATDGLINGLIADAGIDPYPFLTGNQLQVLTSLAVVSAWRGFGYSMLILLAGLKNIPEDLLEAATLDGANATQRFVRVTLPLLRPVVFFVLVIETIAAFQVFDTIYVMTGGGPSRASYSLVYALYDQGFKFFDFGYAAAIGVAIFLIVFLISLIQRGFLDRSNS
ncbi:carbohydrate ABC transporter permease [Ruania halotolerans]|uniref:carbohydrate ABC transporter permease n=1 Tax=Ruania halotolerans TaxID=2897773 RepID=UPI001E40B943|nr:sugar ABC transporter permease [Ruania halotolerans]UFU07596.1 sugar ABC transporter permease [Ruania halotolerans]